MTYLKHNFIIITLLFFKTLYPMELGVENNIKDHDQYHLLETIVNICNAKICNDELAMQKILQPLSSDINQLTDLKNASSALKIDWLNKLFGRHIENHCIARCIHENSLKDVLKQVGRYLLVDEDNFKHELALFGCEKIKELDGVFKDIINDNIIYRKQSLEKYCIYNVKTDHYSSELSNDPSTDCNGISNDQKKIAFDELGFFCNVSYLDSGECSCFNLGRYDAIAWHPNSTQLFFLRLGILFILDIETTMINLFMDLPGETKHAEIAINKTGTYVFIATKTADYIVDLQNKTIKHTFKNNYDTWWWSARKMEWAADDTIIIKEISINGVHYLYLIKSFTGELIRILKDFGRYSLSNDGKRIAIQDATRNLYIIDIKNWQVILKLEKEVLPNFFSIGLNDDGTQLIIGRFNNPYVLIYDIDFYHQIKKYLDQKLSCAQSMLLYAIRESQKQQEVFTVDPESQLVYDGFGNDKIGVAIKKAIKALHCFKQINE